MPESKLKKINSGEWRMQLCFFFVTVLLDLPQSIFRWKIVRPELKNQQRPPRFEMIGFARFVFREKFVHKRRIKQPLFFDSFWSKQIAGKRI